MASSKSTREKPPKAAKRELVDQRLVKALGHPVRANALAILNERVASPNEIAKELGEHVGHVSYHVKVLKDCDCIELVSTAPRRGAVEHYYRATARAFLSDEEWQRLPASIKPSLSVTLLKDVIRDVSDSLEAGIFDERSRHLSWTPMVVDEEGWKELNSGLEEMLDRVLQIQACSAERLADSGDDGIPVSVAMMGFETVGTQRSRKSRDA